MLTTNIEFHFDSPIAQPFDCPVVYDWIQKCLGSRSLAPFMTLPELVASRSESSSKNARDRDQWIKLTPRTLLFVHFFAAMQIDWTPIQFVEALSSAGANPLILETLPEAILSPLQEAIVRSQTEPPVEWSKELLALVGREDVTVLLTPGQRPNQTQSTLLVRPRYLLHRSNLIYFRHLLTKLV
jgi:anaphase-promoting complex subunit 1